MSVFREGNRLQVLGIDHKHLEMSLQDVKDRFPETTGTFHGDMRCSSFFEPVAHAQQVSSHGAKCPPLLVPMALCIGSDGTDNDILVCYSE